MNIKSTNAQSISLDLTNLPEVIDPGANMTNSGWTILNSTSITLFDMAEDQSLIGRLAESWNSYESGRRYRVKIRSGARFHDGSIISIRDVVFSLKRKRKLWPTYELFDWIDLENPNSIHAINDREIEFRLKKPYPYFLFLLALPGTGIVPHQIYPPSKIYSGIPIFGGPYQFTKLKNDKIIELKWFDGWFEKRGNRPEYITISEKPHQVRLERFLAGKTDIFFDSVMSLPIESATNEFKNRFVSHFPVFNSVLFAYLNTQHGPFKSKKIREAFAEALKRRLYNLKQNPNFSIYADQFFPPGYSGRSGPYQEPRPDPQFDKTFEKLRKNPVRIRYPFQHGLFKNNTPPQLTFLKEHGFEIVPKVTTSAEIRKMRNRGTGFEFAHWFIPIPPGDPCLVFRLDFGKDDFYIPDPNNGKLYKLIKKTTIGGTLEERIKLAIEINRYIMKRKFIVPLLFQNTPTFARTTIDLSHFPKWEFNVKFSDIHIKR